MSSGDLKARLQSLSASLSTGRVSDELIVDMQRLSQTLDGKTAEELREIRRIAMMNCDIALAARKGVLAASRLIRTGGSAAKVGIYGQNGSPERLGRAPATISISI